MVQGVHQFVNGRQNGFVHINLVLHLACHNIKIKCTEPDNKDTSRYRKSLSGIVKLNFKTPAHNELYGGRPEMAPRAVV